MTKSRCLPRHMTYPVVVLFCLLFDEPFQGLAVAILFCLCNQEVVAQVRRKIQLTSCFKHRYMQCSTNGQPACVQASVHHDQHRASTVGSIL